MIFGSGEKKSGGGRPRQGMGERIGREFERSVARSAGSMLKRALWEVIKNVGKK